MSLQVKCWCRVYIVAALAVAGCAKPSAIGGDDLGPGVGGNGPGDLAMTTLMPDLARAPLDLAHAPPDLTPICGDGVCNASIGEACDTCPEDCGVCKQCAPGTADCNHMMSDGCETDITTTSDCGACGRVCAQAGGTNACVSNGTMWQCKPTCDANHADCNGDPNDGCETDITTTANCGGCGFVCTNPHGNSACTASGATHICSPTCSAGWAACDSASDGCTTDINGSPDHCGSCTRACSTVGVATRACTNGLCTPTCNQPFADCSETASPAADDGCETNGTVDPGENDNTCSGQYSSTGEGSSTTITTNRILPTTDVDTFQVHLSEGSHTCFPLTGQSYEMRIDLTPPSGTDLRMRYTTSSCNNSWTDPAATWICIPWSGTCGATDDRDFYFQVYGNGGASSCGYYTLTVTYASQGNKPAGCP